MAPHAALLVSPGPALEIFGRRSQGRKYGRSEPVVRVFFALQLDYPVVVAAIFVSGVGGTFQYGFSISVMTSPSEVSPPEPFHKEKKRRPGR